MILLVTSHMSHCRIPHLLAMPKLKEEGLVCLPNTMLCIQQLDVEDVCNITDMVLDVLMGGGGQRGAGRRSGWRVAHGVGGTYSRASGVTRRGSDTSHGTHILVTLAIE